MKECTYVNRNRLLIALLLNSFKLCTITTLRADSISFAYQGADSSVFLLTDSDSDGYLSFQCRFYLTKGFNTKLKGETC